MSTTQAASTLVVREMIRSQDSKRMLRSAHPVYFSKGRLDPQKASYPMPPSTIHALCHDAHYHQAGEILLQIMTTDAQWPFVQLYRVKQYVNESKDAVLRSLFALEWEDETDHRLAVEFLAKSSELHEHNPALAQFVRLWIQGIVHYCCTTLLLSRSSPSVP